MSPPARGQGLKDAFRIVTQIRRVVRAINLYSQQLSREVGLTVPQLVLLRSVADSPDQTSTATQLRKELEVNAATMSGLVDRLVRRGLLDRVRSQRDRRVVHLGLTDAGRSLLEGAPAPLQEQVVTRLAGLPAQERQQILATLEQVVTLMEADELDVSSLEVPGGGLGSD